MDGVYRVDLGSGKHERIGQHRSYASSVAWIGGEQILSAGYDGTLQWRMANAETDAAPTREVQAHGFWSWDMAVSADRSLVATVTGQYLAGDYKYQPAAATEPTVKVFRVADGGQVHAFSMTPSVQAVAISPDAKHAAAGNLMGDVRVWNLETGELAAEWNTDAFTSWGIIKSHCYIGGIFAIEFTPDGDHVLLAGMGPMRDPMAGNGKQLWQKFAWRDKPAKKLDETHRGDGGEGLMETLAIHPSGKFFVMAGRLRGGQWNTAFFDLNKGELLHSLRTDFRATKAAFYDDGRKLIVAGLATQGHDNKPFGRYHLFDVGPT
jgi:WD40 repeat protein